MADTDHSAIGHTVPSFSSYGNQSMGDSSGTISSGPPAPPLHSRAVVPAAAVVVDKSGGRDGDGSRRIMAATPSPLIRQPVPTQSRGRGSVDPSRAVSSQVRPASRRRRSPSLPRGVECFSLVTPGRLQPVRDVNKRVCTTSPELLHLPSQPSASHPSSSYAGGGHRVRDLSTRR